MKKKRNKKLKYIRRVKLERAYNVRDLGGFQTENNETTKWNLLFRSDNLSHLTKRDWSILVEYKIRTIVDLRSSSEVRLQSYCVPEGITYFHSPLQKEEVNLSESLESAGNAFTKSMMEGYLSIIDTCTEELAKTLCLITEGLEQGAVLFHCTAGKDRTGVVAAVLLYLLEVSKEDIIADYQVSYTYNKNGINTMMKKIPQYEQLKHLLYSNPEDMEELLIHMEQISLTKKLSEYGFDASHTALLKSCMLDKES